LLAVCLASGCWGWPKINFSREGRRVQSQATTYRYLADAVKVIGTRPPTSAQP
jgi:hypothetical protein